MKKIFIDELKDNVALNTTVELFGWLTKRRRMGKVVFLTLTDSTGSIQIVIERNKLTADKFSIAKSVSLETGVRVEGLICINKKHDMLEVVANDFEVYAEATLNLSPRPRSDVEIFEHVYVNNMLDNRHIYLRNPKVMAVLRFRSEIMRIAREWFYKNRFMEFDAPILTPAPLYDDTTAMPIEVHGESVFLTQCAGFYLEAAAHAFERVFNMGPSFRGEESRSKRHLMEYWHIKAEATFGDREDIMVLVEEMISYLTRQCLEQCSGIIETVGNGLCTDGLKTPFPRISYEEAVKYLKGVGQKISFGEGVSTADEEILSELYDSPFWIVGIPRSVEPFPYSIDPSDDRVTMVADLIASNGCGELLGVAEKIYDPEMLDIRLGEKGKKDDPRYRFVREVHQAGCVPHIAFGMGLERLIRWFLGLEHVRDAIPFPRVVRRRVYP